MVAEVIINDGVFSALVAVLVVLLTGGVGAVGWTVVLLWRTTVAVGRLEERLDDLERRVDDHDAGGRTP